MGKLLNILARGLRFCILLLVVSLSVCLAGGLVIFPETGEKESPYQTPQVTVVEPGQSAPAGEGKEETGTGESGTDMGESDKAVADTAGAGEPAGGGREEAGQAADGGPVTLLFGGDLFLTELLQTKYSQQGISAAASEGLLSVLKSADVFMVNEEFPFGTTGEPMADKQYTFRVDPGYVSVLSDLGVDMVTLANNHMLDYGRSPLTETLQTLDGAGIAHVGAGENLEEAKALKTFEIHGKTIGFLGASRVIPEYSWNAAKDSSGLFTTYDAAALVEEIEKAEEICDFTVVYVHWGIEKSTRPEEYQKSLARQYIDAGADAVIGAHPHVLQGIEYYEGKPVFYSLGNFIFSNGTYETMLAELTLDGTGTEIRLIPCVSQANRMTLLEEEKKADFYQSLQGLSYGITIGSDGTVSP